MMIERSVHMMKRTYMYLLINLKETFIRIVSLIFISPCKPSKKHVLWQICYVEKKGTVSDNHVIFFTEYFVLYIYNGNNRSNYKFMCCQIQRATRKNNMRCFDQSL